MAGRLLRIGLIPGDGIGREVIPAGRRLLEALPSSLGLRFQFTDLEAGFDTFTCTGNALPRRTVDVLSADCDGALFGAVSSPTSRVKGYSSPIVGLRKEMDLYANIRPVVSVAMPGFAVAHPIVLVIVRENTEDLYIKEERTFEAADGSGTVAEAIKRITRRACLRIAAIGGEIALRRQALRPADAPPPVVILTHKSNVLPQTDGLFRVTAREILTTDPRFLDGSGTPRLRIQDQLADSMVYRLFREAHLFDVIVAPNMYGDLLSDAAAALVGSLGLVPSANVGDNFVMGEPCHGSAPDIMGKGIANPIATLRSTALMLDFLRESAAATHIYAAIDASLHDGKFLTPDLGGTASTEDALMDVLKRL